MMNLSRTKVMGEPNIVISGAGVAGLLLALSLKKQGLNVVVYEQAPEFGEGVGGTFFELFYINSAP